MLQRNRSSFLPGSERVFMTPLTKGYIIAIIGITLWSTTGIFIGYLMTNYAMSPLLIAFWRNLLVCVAAAPALFFIRPSLLRLHRSQIRFFVSFGLLLALFNSAWVLSVQANGAAVSTVLAYSSAGFTAILAWWFFKEQLGLPKIAAVTLSLIGCVLVANAYDPKMWAVNPLGIITGLVSGVLFAGYNLMGKEAAKRRINPWTSLLYTFAFASLFTFLFVLFWVVPGAGSLSAVIPDLPANGWLMLIILSLIPTVIGFGLYNTSMNYLPASTVSLLATSEPALTAVEAYIFLNERMSIVQIVGGLLILSAVIMVRLEKEARTPVLANSRQSANI
jgi:DME family drug/metabolite transporter